MRVPEKLSSSWLVTSPICDWALLEVLRRRWPMRITGQAATG